jgi:DNA-binding CsgD family transcriptional regulator
MTAMALLERRMALQALAEAADQARAGDGRLILITGEAGVGKTALLARFHESVPDAAWAEGACDGLVTPLPLGPLYEIAAQFGGDLRVMIRSAPSRIDLFAALLQRLESPSTLDVVVLEDLHWADEATVDLLRYVGRRIGSTRSLVIATYRSDDLPERHPLRVALGDLAVRPSTRRIELLPLSRDGVGRLAARTEVDPDELFAVTGGNAFFVMEVLRSGLRTVPPSARDSVLGRALRSGPAARGALDAAALMGRFIDVPTLREVADVAEPVVAELLAGGLLVDDGGLLRFRHEIARRTIEEAVPVHRRIEIHRRILEVLQRRGRDDPTLLAFHAAAAGEHALVLQHAPRAAAAAIALRSHREAAAHLELAVAAAAALGAPEEAGFCDSLAIELATIDRVEDAEQVGRRALRLWGEAHDRLREGDALRRLSRVLWRRCRSDDAVDAAERALAMLEPLGDSSELGFALAALAGQRMLRGRAHEAIDLARRAAAMGEWFGLPALTSDALDTEACALAAQDREWEPVLRRALAIATEAGAEEQAARAYANLAGLLCDEYRSRDALPILTDADAYCSGRDLETYLSVIRGLRALVLLRRGRWNDAVAIARQLLQPPLGSPINTITPLIVIGLGAARLGTDEVWGPLDAALDAAVASAEPDRVAAVRLARAEACWLEGRLAAAQAEAREADLLAPTLPSHLAGAVAVWLNRLGLDPPGREVVPPFALELQQRFVEAADAWFDEDCPYLAALALLGSRREQDLRRAFEVLHALGAERTQRIVRAKLRAIGATAVPTGARSAALAHPAGLTGREQEVLQELRLGRSNAEIAARLVISVKTVDHHVTRIFAKLGVHSRGEAAAFAEPHPRAVLPGEKGVPAGEDRVPHPISSSRSRS